MKRQYACWVAMRRANVSSIALLDEAASEATNMNGVPADLSTQRCTNRDHGRHQSDTRWKAFAASLVASVSSHTELALLCRSEMIGMNAGSDVMSSDACPSASLVNSFLKTCRHLQPCF